MTGCFYCRVDEGWYLQKSLLYKQILPRTQFLLNPLFLAFFLLPYYFVHGVSFTPVFQQKTTVKIEIFQFF
jgi:TRAP-type mannitol/chloroaromatic compound transport system permease small subunit